MHAGALPGSDSESRGGASAGILGNSCAERENFVELMTSDRTLKAFREVSQRRNYGTKMT